MDKNNRKFFITELGTGGFLRKFISPNFKIYNNLFFLSSIFTFDLAYLTSLMGTTWVIVWISASVKGGSNHSGTLTCIVQNNLIWKRQRQTKSPMERAPHSHCEINRTEEKQEIGYIRK